VTSDGQYAVVGGAASFVADLRESLGFDQEAALQAFVRDWRETGRAGGSVEWIPRLLDHVFGPGEGLRLWV